MTVPEITNPSSDATLAWMVEAITPFLTTVIGSDTIRRRGGVFHGNHIAILSGRRVRDQSWIDVRLQHDPPRDGDDPQDGKVWSHVTCDPSLTLPTSMVRSGKTIERTYDVSPDEAANTVIQETRNLLTKLLRSSHAPSIVREG